MTYGETYIQADECKSLHLKYVKKQLKQLVMFVGVVIVLKGSFL